MFERKALNWLRSWRNNKDHKPLVIRGARQVGKTSLVNMFAKEFDCYLRFNLDVEDDLRLFEKEMPVKDLYSLLLVMRNKVRNEGSTLIFIDEIQNSPLAIKMLRYFREELPEVYVIAAGSLLETMLDKNEQVSFPVGRVEYMALRPCTFEEFLGAMGETGLQEMLCSAQIPEVLHTRIMSLFNRYSLIGGMPQVVMQYAETKDFDKVDAQKRLILNLYRNDIRQYADNLENRVTQIFDEIPAQLQRHEKKFRLSDLKKDARYRDYDSAFLWLADARVINICHSSTEPNIGFRLTQDGNTLKCYMADTGLLISHSFDENGIVSSQLYRKLMLDRLEFNEGMLMENIVAQMLLAAGHKLYFFSSYSKKSADRMEIDFLISKIMPTSRHNVTAIEVKSGKNYTFTSLNKFKEKYGSMLSEEVVLHTEDVKYEDGILYLPLYMAQLL